MKKEYCLAVCKWDDGGIHVVRGPANILISEGSEIFVDTEDGEIHAVIEWEKNISPDSCYDKKMEKMILLLSHAPDAECLDKISAVIYRDDCKYEEEEDETE